MISAVSGGAILYRGSNLIRRIKPTMAIGTQYQYCSSLSKSILRTSFPQISFRKSIPEPQGFVNRKLSALKVRIFC